ncbi:hypothetical protein BC830DRAFT_377459 [Chytriomyces sp. MP71]|nr:hypothetical protein BC830DRAFT_377459 [Chytriomyces sp. MP71]
MSTYANGGDPRRQPQQPPMSASSTGYIPYGQHTNYGQHAQPGPYSGNDHPTPEQASAGSAGYGSTGVGGQPMAGMQQGYYLQHQQQLYAIQQMQYAQMMNLQQQHQTPPNMVFNAQVHVPVPVGYPQYSLPPHMQSQQQYSQPVISLAPMAQRRPPSQSVASKLESRRSPSVQSMAASARARDDDDNMSIASASSRVVAAKAFFCVCIELV